MRKVFLLLALIFSVTFFSSCNDELALEDIRSVIQEELVVFHINLQNLENKIDQLNDLSINQQTSLDQISEALFLIKSQLGTITENQTDQRALIQTMTTLINQMITSLDTMNDDLLSQLQSIRNRLNGFSGDIEDLEEIIKDLLDQITSCGDHSDNELSIRESNTNPNATIFEVENDEVSDWYTLLVFEENVDDDSQDLVFNKRFLTIHTPGASVRDVIKDMELRINGDTYDDTNYLVGGSGSIAIIEIDVMNENSFLGSDNEQEGDLRVRFNSADGTNYSPGQTIFAEVTSDNVDLWDVEDTEGNRLTSNQLQGAAEGNIHTLLVDGAIIELINVNHEVLSSSSNSPNDTFKFTFNVEMETLDRDIYIPANVLAAFNVAVVGADSDINFNGISSIITSAERVTGVDGNIYFEISNDEIFKIQLTAQPGIGQYFSEIRGYSFTTSNPRHAGFVFDGTYIQIDSENFRSGWVFINN
jgi:hypothetical protein